MPQWIDKIDSKIDQAFELTTLPKFSSEMGGYVGRSFDELLGTKSIEPVGAALGRDLPRMALEGVLTMPEVASVAGAPVAAATWMNRLRKLGRVAGYADAAVMGAADTGSLAGGAINAATLGLGNKLFYEAGRTVPLFGKTVDVGAKGARAVEELAGFSPRKIASEAGSDLTTPNIMARTGAAPVDAKTTYQKIMSGIGRGGADVGAAVGLNEAARQATLSVGPNAVDWDDPSRNPLDPANVAGNLLNSLPMMIGAISAGRAKFQPQQMKDLHNWQLNRREAVMAEAQNRVGRNWEGPVSPQQYFDHFGSLYEAPLFSDKDVILPEDFNVPGRFEPGTPGALAEIQTRKEQGVATTLQAHLDVLRDREFRGDPNADLSRRQIQDILDGSSEGYDSPEGLAVLKQKMMDLDETARQFPPGTPDDLTKHIDNLNAEIDRLNTNNRGMSSVLVGQVAKKGLIERITPEELKMLQEAEMNKSGDLQFSYQVALQQVTNRLTAQMPDAIKAFKELPPEPQPAWAEGTEANKAQRTLNADEHEYITALRDAPMEVREALYKRAAKNRRRPEFYPEGSRRPLTTEKKWREAVIEASQSPDPVAAFKVLTEPDPNNPQNYKWEPKYSTQEKAEGGKPALEGNLLSESEQTIDVVDEPTEISPEKAELMKGLTDKREKLMKVIPTLTDDQLDRIAADAFRMKPRVNAFGQEVPVRDSQAPERKTMFRSAIMATLEDLKGERGETLSPHAEEFLRRWHVRHTPIGATPRKQLSEALRRFWSSGVEVNFESAVKANPKKGIGPAQQRQAHVINRLLDDKLIKTVKQGPVSARVAAGADALIDYAAPARLDRWSKNPTGGITPDKEGMVPTRSVNNLLTRLGVSSDEMELYNAAGLQKILTATDVDKIGVEQLVDWMDSVTPNVEVKTLLPDVASTMSRDEQQVQRAQIQHEFETAGFRIEDHYGDVQVYKRDEAGDWAMLDDDVVEQQLGSDLYAKAHTYASIVNDEGPINVKHGDAATGKYGVEPKELKNMPGAVDILVRIPQKANPKAEWRESRTGMMKVGTEPPLFQGPHFGQTDKNVLASVRGYMETLPSGEKVFHVYEVQSDWGQTKAKDAKLNEQGRRLGYDDRRTPDHPLLAVYEQLALKAAVKHAKEQGATKVAISDGETAMMTESHDQFAKPTANKMMFPEVKGREIPSFGQGGWTLTGEARFDPDSGQTFYTITKGSRLQNEIALSMLLGLDMKGLKGVPGGPTIIPQERGMRSAYDQRLPATMEKLTGQRGSGVDFGRHKYADEGRLGPHVKGGKLFGNKTNITARMYDVSSVPDVTTAFGYAKPQKGKYGGFSAPDDMGNVESPNVSRPEDNVLTDTTPPGSWTADVYATFRDRFDTFLGEAGYSGSMRDMYTEMAVALAQQLPGKMVDFYRIVHEPNGPSGLAMVRDGRGKLGIDMQEYSPSIGIRTALDLLGSLAHEISHIDSFISQGLIDAPDAFSMQRYGHRQNLDKMALMATPTERAAMLNTLDAALFPEEYRVKRVEPTDSSLPYGSLDPEEFTAEINRIMAFSLLKGSPGKIRNALEVLDYSPTEVAEFAKGTFRSLSDILEGMKTAAANSDPLLDKFFTSTLFGGIIETAREASKLRDSEKALKQAQAYTASLSLKSGGAFPLVSEALWFHTSKSIGQSYQHTDVGPKMQAMPTAASAVRLANQFIASRAYDQMHMPGIWARWFYPFTNLMESMQRSGFDLARPMAELANGIEATVTRLRSGMLSEFIIKQPDGSIAWSKNNELIKRINEGRTGPWRDVFNDLSAWQQENKTMTIFVQDPQTSQIIVNSANPGAQAKWDSARRRLSVHDQQVVMSGMVAMDKTEQIKARYLSKSLDEGNTYRIARVLMGVDRAMFHDQALATAQQVIAAYQQGNALALNALLPNPRLRQMLDGLLIGPEGLLTRTAEATQKLQNRLGHRSESLPHEWILRYADTNGVIQYASAQSKHKGAALMAKLRSEGKTQAGEIINKKDLREFMDYDDPDTLLQKYTEIETEKWSRFVADLETAFGPAFAAEMQGYVPGAALAKELSTQGLNKFLVERRNLIDRENFDYIDGTLASAGRLAATIAFKTARQSKDLMLADPRARQFPSFSEMVNSHFDRMMEPNGQGAKELKAFSTAMMMGGSLASVLINLSQSMVSLVPIMIQYDKTGVGPIGAWKGLTKAIADTANISTSDKWQAVAAAAESRPPNTWTLDESRAVAYKWSMRDGGIDHGIILDNLYTPTDQATAINAKFGRGDYGPATVGELVRSPISVAAQLSLKPFGWAERFNNKVSLMAGVDQAYAQGLRGEALYEHAKLVKNLSTYGGGKANAIGFGKHFQSTPFSRSAFGVVNNLQQYGYGIVATYAQLVKDSLGKSAGLTPMERRQAMKAFGTMLATQVAISGALGVPFAAAALTMLEKIFGVPANQLVREGLASLSDDKAHGAAIAETALNGIGNQMFGIDVSSRLGVSNLLGTSSYRGFNLSDMAGPTGSIVGNMTKSLGYFAQNEPMKGMTELVPNSFRNLVQMADSKLKYGDRGIRDSGDNLLYNPTPSQAALYLAGFRPAEVSQKRQAQVMTTFANQRASRQRDHTLDQHGRALLQGDPTQAMQYAYGLQAVDPTIDAQSVLRSIVQRSVDATTEKDLLASGPTANEGERQGIAETFQPGVVTRQSEMQRTLLSTQLGTQLGLAPDPKQFQRAALVDVLVKQRNIPRSQALRLVEFLR